MLQDVFYPDAKTIYKQPGGEYQRRMIYELPEELALFFQRKGFCEFIGDEPVFQKPVKPANRAHKRLS